MAVLYVNFVQTPEHRRDKYNLARVAGLSINHAMRARDMRRSKFIAYVRLISGQDVDPGPIQRKIKPESI